MKAILKIACPPPSSNHDGALVREKIRGGMVYEVEGQIVCLSDKASYSLPVA